MKKEQPKINNCDFINENSINKKLKPRDECYIVITHYTNKIGRIDFRQIVDFRQTKTDAEKCAARRREDGHLTEILYAYGVKDYGQ